MSTIFAIRAGDTTPAFTATVLDAAGAVLDLTGKTVKLVVRAPSSSTPVVNAAMSVVLASAGTVSYAWSTADTATAGLYVAEIHVTTTAGGATYTFPNQGYIDLEVVANLTGTATSLVSVADAKDALNMDPLSRAHDSKILRWIRGLQPVIERLVGPVLIQTVEEWHEGGSTSIILRRRPSTALGTSPYLLLNAISEYAGPIEWPLAQIASPDLGQTYSAMLDKNLGQVTRRTAGGGTQAFPWGPQAVHVWYTTGQSSVPDNVYEAVLDLLASNYRAQAQALRRGSSGSGRGGSDIPDTAPAAFLIPNRVRELLAPNRRAPSIA